MSEFDESTKTYIYLREKSGLKFFDGPPSFTPDGGLPADMKPVIDANLTVVDTIIRLGPYMSADGSKMLLVGAEGTPLTVKTLSGGATGATAIVPEMNCEFAYFSPHASFVVTFSAAQRGKDGSPPPPNLKIWRMPVSGTGTATLESSFHMRKCTDNPVQWTEDERLCARVNTNEVHLYDGKQPSKGISEKIYHQKVSQFQLSLKWQDDGVAHIAVFTPEEKGKPARVSAYAVTLTSGGAVVVRGECAQRTVFQASEAKLLFSPSCETLLIHTHSDVDTTGASYFGATGLFVMRMDGSLAEQVAQSKPGPVYDVQWSPVDDIFAVAAGTMPAHCTLYNARADREFEFGAAHRNTISWSPHGRFLCLAGFGNLAGDMDFYDMNRRKVFGSANAHCAVQCSWSPDSRYFMTATLAPRMNVDNGFKVFKYNGAGPIVAHQCSVLAYACMFVPGERGRFPNRPPSPNSRRVKGAAGEEKGASKTTAATEAYRPPGARGCKVSEMMRAGSGTAPTGKVRPTPARTNCNVSKIENAFDRLHSQRTIPGLHTAALSGVGDQRTSAGPRPDGPFSKSAQKNARRKAAAKLKKQDIESLTVEESLDCRGSGSSSSDGKNMDDSLATSTMKVGGGGATSAPVILAEWNDDDPVQRERKAKSLRKKLKQITDLKAKRDSGALLNDDQIQKIEGESTLLDELSSFIQES